MSARNEKKKAGKTYTIAMSQRKFLAMFAGFLITSILYPVKANDEKITSKLLTVDTQTQTVRFKARIKSFKVEENVILYFKGKQSGYYLEKNSLELPDWHENAELIKHAIKTKHWVDVVANYESLQILYISFGAGILKP